MVLTNETLKDKAFWEEHGYRLPKYDRDAMLAKTVANPTWLHFGAGNIFKAFQADACQRLLDAGLAETGIIAGERREKKPEVKQKVIRTVATPNTFKVSAHMGVSRSQNFQMDLSLARGAAGDGVAVDAGTMENVIYEAGEVDEQAQVLREIQPKFPERAKKMGVSGYVKVFIVIDVNGDVSQAQVLTQDPAGYGFDIEALKAIRQWKFSPAQLRGFPVAQKATKEFRFVK